ncbi:hypothetical protein [Streptomyces tremellae]|uniref:Uncharacterized protein n=1 Tax=Streptomyces tremellae TaxID=1124239 RepID=A0ABP7EF73_9ACTN
MTQWLAGMRITADRLNDHSEYDDTTTTGLVAATGFTVSAFSGKKRSGITYVDVFVTRTGGDMTSSGGNITDTQMCVLPVNWQPGEVINGQWGQGLADGECTINPDGTIVLRSANGTIGNNTNLRVTSSWPTP